MKARGDNWNIYYTKRIFSQTIYRGKYAAVAKCALIKQDIMKGHAELNMYIIFGSTSISMLCSKTEQIISTSFENADYQSWRVFETM